MPIEQRADGSLVLRMHVPLAASVLVMLLLFGFGFMFAYALFFESASEVIYRGIDLGFRLDPLVWRGIFLAGTFAMLIPGLVILIGLMRGSKPYVYIGKTRLELRDRPMARDIALRWDEIALMNRFRIQRQPAIIVKGRDGQKVQLSGHAFAVREEFEIMCDEIEFRMAQAKNGIPR